MLNYDGTPTTWGDIKRTVERLGVADETIVDWIDVDEQDHIAVRFRAGRARIVGQDDDIE
jgi:hypothetical protein